MSGETHGMAHSGRSSWHVVVLRGGRCKALIQFCFSGICNNEVLGEQAIQTQDYENHWEKLPMRIAVLNPS